MIMQPYTIQQTDKGLYSLPAKELPARAFKAVSSPLASVILQELAKEPLYPKALAKRIRVHEQKVYYHVRNMLKAGFLKVVRKETLGGTTAIFYGITEPSFILRTEQYRPATKLTLSPPGELLTPFIQNGMLNALIVVGSPDPHGPERARSRDGYYGIDLALFLGTFLSHVAHHHVKLDTETRAEDLRNNLILIGGPIVNKAVEKMNEKLPIYFDPSQRWAVYSRLSGETYPSDETGLIVKARNPFNKEKYVLVVAGKRYAGTRAAILSFLRYAGELAKGNLHNPRMMAKVVEGIDNDGDGVVDAIEVRE
ncbi:S-layer protein [Candidatus Woesearchaeota archaeon]|nr:S-layer protein [Candidatus Woesearchaeota archaeon]